MEKSWVSQCPWFRINTTVIGMTVTDAFLLATASQMKVFKSMTILEFADRLSWDMMNNQRTDGEMPYFIPSRHGSQRPPPIKTLQYHNGSQNSVCSEISPASLSLSSNSTISTAHINTEMQEKEVNQNRIKRRLCIICKKKTTYHCIHPKCLNRKGYNGILGSPFCRNGDCFLQHLIAQNQSV